MRGDNAKILTYQAAANDVKPVKRIITDTNGVETRSNDRP